GEHNTEGGRRPRARGEPLNVRAAPTLGARHRGASLCVSDDRAARGERDEERDDKSGDTSVTPPPLLSALRSQTLVQQSGGSEVPAGRHRSQRHVGDGKRTPNGLIHLGSTQGRTLFFLSDVLQAVEVAVANRGPRENR